MRRKKKELQLKEKQNSIRALVYFELVNLYALPYSDGNAATNPGVPLVLESLDGYDPDRDKLPRASVEAVYTQILADLD